MDEFRVEQTISIQFSSQDQSKVTQDIKLINQNSLIYAKQYSLLAPNDVSNIQVNQNGQSLPFNTQQQNEQNNISFLFPSAVTGKNEYNHFTISYQLPSMAKQSGQLWDVFLPAQHSSHSTITTYELSVPDSWGPLAQSSFPGLKPSNEIQPQIIFSTPENYSQPITLSFGQARIFQFQLSYFLENDSEQLKELSIPIPPDTFSQQISYSSIEPQPLNIIQDQNGNFLASYKLNKQTQKKITVSGFAKIGPNNSYLQAQDPGYIDQNKQNDANWPKLDVKLTTIKDIYQKVISTLTYNPTRAQNPKAQSVAELLANPQNAICTDFTNYFISLARSNGFASRQVIGWANSENQITNPLSENTDILHSWVQYYDPVQKNWKETDPTWASTTNGVDYLNSFDLNHLTFVIHSSANQDPQPPGYYKQIGDPKSVLVTQATKNFKTTSNPLSVQTKYNLIFSQIAIIKNPNLNSYHGLPPLHQYEQKLPLVFFQTLTLADNTKHYFYNFRLIGFSLTFLILTVIIFLSRITYAKNS